MEPVSLYIHIPFCRSKCFYCAFYKDILDKDLCQEFIAAVKQEIMAYALRYPETVFGTLYVGGGTPSCLQLDLLEELLEFTELKFRFLENAEKTIEMNPETVTQSFLDLLKKYSFNRLSTGIQSFSDNELNFLGRNHMLCDIEASLHLIKKNNFHNINMDLIFGLPGSSKETFINNLKTAASFNPAHISTYSLSIEHGADFYKQKIEVIDQEEELSQYKAARHYLSENGFDHYEISAFAKKGFYCKHNLVYWSYKPYIGIGPAASSFYQNRIYSNVPDIRAYIKEPLFSVNNILKTNQTTKDMLIKEYIIANFRRLDGLSINDFKHRFDLDFNSLYKDTVAKLVQEGLLCQKESMLSLTERGLFLLNNVLLEFM
ncbi:MAG: radical SAM family heme chaperone HemW [bacterium]|nr:radical SAM family heme chaperone HemW [bacterium]